MKTDLEKINWRSLSESPNIVGVDEVGRGCLAGPVVAGAVLLKSDDLISRLADSKQLSEKQREELSPLIANSHCSAIGFAACEEIDEINILQASLLAMRRAVEELEKKFHFKADLLLVDGTFQIPNFNRRQMCFVQGDARVAPISAASIVAKVYRDQLMKGLAEEYPGYGFEKHKGYASATHKKAIVELGPTNIHRKSFRGVKEHIRSGL